MWLICYWRQRQLARHAVLQAPLLPRSMLAQHLARCPECTEAYRDLVSLQRDVLERLPVRTISPDFDAYLMARLAAEMRGGSPRRPSKALRMVRPLALGGGIVVAMMIGSLLWRIHMKANLKVVSSKPELTPGRSPRSLPHERAVAADPRMAATSQMQQTRRPQAIAAEAPSWPLRSHSHHRGHHRGAMSAKAFYAGIDRDRIARQHRGPMPSQPNAAPVLRVTSAKTWRELGQVFEACGDYSRACQTYGRALAKQPDADLAIAASETAERTGDSAGALTYLAQLLSEGSNGETTPPNDPQERYQEQ